MVSRSIRRIRGGGNRAVPWHALLAPLCLWERAEGAFFLRRVQVKGSSRHQSYEEGHMDSMDNVRERIEALEQQTEQLKHQTQALAAQTHALQAHTRTVERRLRWWRGFAWGMVLLTVMSRSLHSGTAADTPPGAMGARMATLEDKLSTLAFDATANEVVISGANLRIVNGLGATGTTNGLGNLIVGYNEPRGGGFPDTRTGSHTVVVGMQHNFSRFGGIVVGYYNEISGSWASVSGGAGNTASGELASVSNGFLNIASGYGSSVSGGSQHIASGYGSSVSGGNVNTASGDWSSVSGGAQNTASTIQTASKSYLQKWGVKATLLDRLTLYRSIPRFLWYESFILPLRRIVAHQNALQRVGSA